MVLNNGGSYTYRYNLSDLPMAIGIGNVRTSFDIYGGAVRILQRDDYYAFGLRKLGSPNDDRNKYLYNGKELQDELEQYDYGARFYDPVIGRWNVVDPLAENYDNVSPYNYGLNNPIFYIDPDGRSTEGFYNDYIFDKDGKLKDVIENDLPDRFYQQDASGNVNQIDNLTVDMAGQYLAASVKYIKDGGTLGEVEIKGQKYPDRTFSPLTIGVYPLEKGLEMSFPLERLNPRLGLFFGTASIVGFVLEMSSGQGKGERRQSAKADGTDNPFKKLKPDPNKPGNVLEKNSHTGKTVSKPAPPGFWDWWKSK